jgi:glycosyltransferase involved in cell wall biosynthesis
MKILIIIPAYNEEDNIERVVNNLISNYPNYDYVVVNDGSKDNTVKICRDNGYNLIDLPMNLGLSGGFQTGIKYAYKHNYDAALQFDGDGQHDPKYIEQMINEMLCTNSDIVIGSRFKNKKKPKGLRMLGSNLIQLAIRITTGHNITDPTSGMRLINCKVLKEFAFNMNYGPEPDTISYLMLCGVKVSEVQVEMHERIAGESYLNLKRAILYMIRMCTSIILIQRFRKRSV